MDNQVITKKQEEVLKEFKNNFFPIHPIQLDAIFMGGYDVQPDFKLNDWIVFDSEYHKCVMRVIGVSEKNIEVEPYHEGFRNSNCISLKNPLIRLATPEEIKTEKQRRWWGGHGREVNEYKPGDIVSAGSSSLLCLEVYGIDCDGDARLRQHDETIFLRKPEQLTVICFAENREDVNNDE